MRPFIPSCFVALMGTAAQADLTFCNDSAIRATVAIGYAQGDGWASEGWWGIEPGDCRTVVSGELPKRYYYWRATTKSGPFAEGGYRFCTDPTAFTIEGDSDCVERGHDSALFHEVDIGQARDHTVRLLAEDAPKQAQRKSPAVDTARKAPAAPAPTPALAAPQADNGPGTFGEPYSIEAVFHGCWAVAEDLECEFRADGYRYVAYESGPTDPYMIERLASFPEGGRYAISGDMISYEGDLARITVRQIDAAGAPPPPPPAPVASGQYDGLMEFLQGNWETDDGSGTGWMISGNVLRHIHDANIAEEYHFTLNPHCAASNGQGPVIIGYPEYDPSMGPSCFLVTETGPRHLVIHDVGEGYTLSFSYSQ